MFKGIANFASILKQAQQLGGRMDQLTEEMRKRRVTGTAGGGMVEIDVNGLMEVLRCTIDPQLLAQNDRELIEDLVVAAINQAIGKGKLMHADSIRDMTDDLPLPGGLHKALAKFTGMEESPGEEERGVEE